MTGPLIVVSGLPRSGTSMMMRMLEAGGVPPLTDGRRAADTDNPRGYYELEAVKGSARSTAWLDGAGGKAVKVVSPLLAELPGDRSYQVIFMRRPLDEVLASQAAMLERRGEPQATPDSVMREQLAAHLETVEQLLRERADMRALFVSYSRTVANPDATCRRVADFLDRAVDVDAMRGVIEPALYRNRHEG